MTPRFSLYNQLQPTPYSQKLTIYSPHTLTSIFLFNKTTGGGLTIILYRHTAQILVQNSVSAGNI